MRQLTHPIRTILTLSCEEASRLMSDSHDRRLLWWERLAIRGHLIACRVCPGVKRQLELVTRAAEKTDLNEVVSGHTQPSTTPECVEKEPCLAPECREAILRKMRELG